MSIDIVCLSGNPALDRRVHLPSLRLGHVNRAERVEPMPGGKAAHVAMASRALGLNPVWVGFLGGPIGETCAARLRALDIAVTAAPTAVSTRVNLELVEDSGVVTEVLEPGAAPAHGEQADFIDHCSRALEGEWKNALLAISGSLPLGMRPDFYGSILAAAHEAGSKTFLDTSGEWLIASLRAEPEFVKINAAEANLIWPPSQNRSEWALRAAKEVISRGARSAAVTLGDDGLVWCERAEGPAWLARPPKLKCISAVGSGDTTFAGFAYAARKQLVGEEAVRFAAACGAANCLASLTALISMEDVKSLMRQIEVRQM